MCSPGEEHETEQNSDHFHRRHLFFLSPSQVSGPCHRSAFRSAITLLLPRDLFPDPVRNVKPAQIKIPKLPREEVYLFVVLKMLVDDDPAGLHHPA